MESDKVVWIVVIALLFLSAIALGLYMSLDKSGSDEDTKINNLLTGNIIYESVEPDTIDPIDSKSITSY